MNTIFLSTLQLTCNNNIPTQYFFLFFLLNYFVLNLFTSLYFIPYLYFCSNFIFQIKNTFQMCICIFKMISWWNDLSELNQSTLFLILLNKVSMIYKIIVLRRLSTPKKYLNTHIPILYNTISGIIRSKYKIK